MRGYPEGYTITQVRDDVVLDQCDNGDGKKKHEERPDIFKQIKLRGLGRMRKRRE